MWIFAGLFAIFAHKTMRPPGGMAGTAGPRLPELRTITRTAVRAYLKTLALPSAPVRGRGVRHPQYLVLGKLSLLVHPERQMERVSRLIPGARAEIISDTGPSAQIDHVPGISRRMLAF